MLKKLSMLLLLVRPVHVGRRLLDDQALYRMG